MRLLRTALVTAALCAPTIAQFDARYTGPPIDYGKRPSADAVAGLVEQLADGEADWHRDEATGYLQALLEALAIPASSQTLVFSKTSFQNDRISPRRPRAIYFGDDAYVGYVPGARFLEVTAMDAEQGPVFYVLDQQPQPPAILRKTGECLTCHGSERTAGWPGHLVRSVHPTRDGHPLMNRRSFVTTHASPYTERWGGWYVTGEHGDMRHMGNVTVPDDAIDGARGTPLDREAGANLTSLDGRIDPGLHPSAHSDLVALLVLEHQTAMHNVLARASYRVRDARHAEAVAERTFGEPSEQAATMTRRAIRESAQEVLEALLFKHEPPLPSPVRGTSSFAADFATRGPRDDQGRSLRELDLRTRLFRHRCSYVIYSPTFDALPQPVLDVVWLRLWRILNGRLTRRSWRLDRDERQTILDVLLATKPGLPSNWQPVQVR